MSWYRASLHTCTYVDEQVTGADHSKGVIEEQDVSIRRSSSVVTKLRIRCDFYRENYRREENVDVIQGDIK